VHDCILLLAKGRIIHYLKPRKAAPNISISGQGRNLLAKKVHSTKHITTRSPPTSGWVHLDHRQPEAWSQRVGTIPQYHRQCHMPYQSIRPTRRRCTQGHRKPRNTTVPNVINQNSKHYTGSHNQGSPPSHHETRPKAQGIHVNKHSISFTKSWRSHGPETKWRRHDNNHETRNMDKPHIPHIHSQPDFTPLGKQLTHDV
jgi:hypothetical protein